MRKLMMLAMVLVAPPPALAQPNASEQYEDAPPVCTGLDPETAQKWLEQDPINLAHLDADGDGIACNEENVPELACEEFATQEEAQKFLNENPGDPYNIDPDGDGVACNFKGSGSQEPLDEGATLSYELTVEGQCPTDTTFFGENNLVGAADYVGTDTTFFGENNLVGAADYVGIAQLTDPDGDGIYTHSEEFLAGSELDGLSLVRGTGVENVTGEFFRGPVPSQPTTIKSFDALTLEEDVTLSASVSCDRQPTEPQNEEVTLDFELTVDGQCPADTNFFAGMSTSHGYSVPLTDSEGDGVYSGSIDFGKGVELLEVLIYSGAGIMEGPYGQISEGEPETIQSFGSQTVEKDETFSATVSCDEPTTKNPGTEPSATKNSQGGSSINLNKNEDKSASNTASEKIRAGIQVLPDTGGMSLMLLGSGVLLIGGGLAARRIFG